MNNCSFNFINGPEISRKEADYIYKQVENGDGTPGGYKEFINKIYIKKGTPFEVKIIDFIDFLKDKNL